MAFDGITIANITKELQETLLGGRIYKIAQPENDALLLTIKNNGSQYRLLLSADASLPLIYLTEKNRQSPMTAPGFCMLLRKHLQNARITAISQPGLERIIHIDLEHLNELGDLCQKKLIVEIMGKHSNIIFCDDKEQIIDSIKHVSAMVSSVREVLPGRTYFIPQTQDKQNPLSLGDCNDSSYVNFKTQMQEKPMPLFKALYTTYTGLSPVIAQEICFRAGVDADLPAKALADTDENALRSVFSAFTDMMSQVVAGTFSPVIIYEGKTPIEFAALPLTLYRDKESCSFENISSVLERYYAERETVTRIRQKSTDLRRIVQTALERNVKKYDLQLRQMEDTKKRDTYKIYGELLNTYGYNAAPGAKTLEAVNYYTGEPVTIPLDDTLTPQENAQKYFDKYGKMKRTYEALSELTIQVKEEIEHLESILSALDIAMQEEDLVQIREALIESGYFRR
ncbi:MAG: NFACT family protein, partial [Lachnospiraceae bacterium]|nr:NFACT family protein [Lachnospiraceae bacterium]